MSTQSNSQFNSEFNNRLNNSSNNSINTSANIELKLRRFIRWYYLHKSFEGLLIFAFTFLIYFLFYLLVESIFYLMPIIKTILFYVSVLVSVVWIVVKVMYPVVQSFVPRLQINFESASKRIGEREVEIDDRLLNLIQLKKLGSNSLILESIKASEKYLFKFDFLKTIDLKSIVKFSKFLIAPVFILAVLSIIDFDKIVAQPTERILLFDTEFNKPLSFQINILNKELKVIEGNDFDLKMKVENYDVNEPLFIYFNNEVFKLNTENTNYIYKFNNAKNTFSFKVGESKDRSYKYTLNVVETPKVKSATLKIKAPKYTKVKPVVVSNLKTQKVCEGSKLEWNVKTYKNNFVEYWVADTFVDFSIINKDNMLWKYSSVADKDFNYRILVSNKELEHYIDFNNSIEIIKDKYPTIDVQKLKTKVVLPGVFYFDVSATDDYKLSRVGYRLYANGKLIETKSTYINRAEGSELFKIDLNKFDFNADASIKFYSTDNDGYNGAKTTFSKLFHVELITKHKQNKRDDDLRDSLLTDFKNESEKKFYQQKIANELDKQSLKKNDASKQLKQLKQDVEKSILNKKNLQRNLNSIKDKKLLKEIEKAIEEQKELLKLIEEELKKKNTNSTKKVDELKKKKQFQDNKNLNFLKKMATKEAMKRLGEMANKLDKDVDEFDESEKSKEELEKDVESLKKQLEKYTQLKNNDELKKVIEKELDKIEDELKEKPQDNNGLKKEDDSLKPNSNKEEKVETDKVEKQKNEEAKSDELNKNDEQKETQKEEQKKEEKKDLGEKKKKDSKKKPGKKQKMKKSSKKIKKKLSKPSGGGGGASMSVDIAKIEWLLNNYLQLSFRQENVITEFFANGVDQQIEQYKVLNSLSLLNDSLYNFAVENPYFTTPTFNKIYPLQNQYYKFNDVYENSNEFKLSKSQRELLRDVNSVTDMLSDMLMQMQNADPNSDGDGEGDSPPQTAPQDLIDQQKELQKKMEEQMKGEKQGETKEGKEGGEKNGESGKGKDGKNKGDEKGNGKQGGLSDEQISDLIKKQEEIRNKFNKMNDKNGGDKEGKDGTKKGGKTGKDLNKEIDELKKQILKGESVKELNKTQQKIIKMLRDFKGEAKEKDKKRKSKSNKDKYEFSLKDLLLDDDTPREEKIERDDIKYQDFYKNKIEEVGGRK